jgi:hypothetical protein
MWNRSFLVYKYWTRSQTLVLKKWKSASPILEKAPVLVEKAAVRLEDTDEFLLQIHCYEYTL